jgi:hypothetical protein
MVRGSVDGGRCCARAECVRGQNAGATDITDYTLTLHATARCDTGEVCKWYWEWWPAGSPRLGGRDIEGSQKSPDQGPVNGPTGEQKLSTSIVVTAGLKYWWVFCASPDNGAHFAYAGPHGMFSPTNADPPPDYATFTSAPGTTLAEVWNGSAWSAQRMPKVSFGVLSAVSCTTARACTAVGDYDPTLAERWNGTTWTIQSPAPGTTPGSTLLAGSVRRSLGRVVHFG